MEVQQTLGGRYKLLNELGSGGMAVVWKARDEVLGRPVAVKVLAGRHADDEQSRARIRDEARAAATLSHANIAQIYDYGESDVDGACHPYVVMELINGQTLAQRVSQGPIPPRAVFRICGEVAAALAAAHAQGLVHRDIKPANVMVTPAGAKVVDFGIAAAAGPGRPDDEVLGTPAYLAPERLLRDTIEPASDVYALGVLLYRLLTNESPWSVESTTQMLDAHVYIEPTPMPQLPGIPPEVTELVHGCLRKEPAGRPTATEVAAILGDAAEAAAAPVAAEPVPVPVPTPAPAPGPRSNRRRFAYAGGGVAVAAVAALMLWIFVPMGAEGRQAGGGAVIAPSATSLPPMAEILPGTAPASGEGGEQTVPGEVKVPGAGGPTGSALPTSAPPAAGTTAPAPVVPAPTNEVTPSSAPTSTTTAAPAGRTLSSYGGTVVAVCKGGKARLTSWTPADGYEVEQVTQGAALAPTIVFKKKLSRVRMTVTCVAGIPTLVALPL